LGGPRSPARAQLRVGVGGRAALRVPARAASARGIRERRMRRPTLRQVIQVVFTIAVVAFMAIYLLRIDWGSLDGLTLGWLPFLIASVIALLYRYWGAGIWLYLLGRLGAGSLRGLWPELAYVYAKAWLGRYILGAGTW